MFSNWTTITALAAVVALAGCSSDAPEPVVATDAAGRLVCEPELVTLTYSTALGSCAESNAKGRQFARDINLRYADEGADIAFVTLCTAIQGDIKMTFSFAEDLRLAQRLSDEGVCPGDLAMLVRK